MPLSLIHISEPTRRSYDLRAVLRRYQYLSVRLLSRVEESLTEHLAILDCIRRRDLARLTELLENHIQY